MSPTLLWSFGATTVLSNTPTFVVLSTGALTGVGPSLSLQWAAAIGSQVGSPPPLTVAVLVTLGSAAFVGVTGITKLAVAVGARPAGIEQVTI